eukprot:7929938-Alexandrium_andersonii.AAC.1
MPRELASWNLRWLVARDTRRAGSKRALLARLSAAGHIVAIQETRCGAIAAAGWRTEFPGVAA